MRHPLGSSGHFATGRSFIGVSGARIIMGNDEAALIRLPRAPPVSCSRGPWAARQATSSRCAAFIIRLAHRVGNEDAGIDPVKVARQLWRQTRSQ